MGNPIWFNIINQWKKMGMGEYGVTFPFLAGAIAKISDSKVTRIFLEELFADIINNPVHGYYCEVRWCDTINEPVVSISRSNNSKNVSIKSYFTSTNNGNMSIAFTTDLMSMFNLNCSTKENCLEKLVEKTIGVAENETFSKNNGAFAAFTEKDIEFLEKVVAYSLFYPEL